jgi:hypothetical protein
MSSFLNFQCQCKRCSRTYAITKEYTFLIIPLVSIMLICGLVSLTPLWFSLPLLSLGGYFAYRDLTRDVIAETQEELKRMTEITEKTAAEFEKELLAEQLAKEAKELEKEKQRKLKRAIQLKEENEQLRKAAAAAAATEAAAAAAIASSTSSTSDENGKKKKKKKNASSTSSSVQVNGQASIYDEEDEEDVFHAAQFALGNSKKAAVVAKALTLNGGSVQSSSVNSSNSTSSDATNTVASSNDIVGVVVEKQRKYHLVLDENGWETLVKE